MPASRRRPATSVALAAMTARRLRNAGLFNVTVALVTFDGDGNATMASPMVRSIFNMTKLINLMTGPGFVQKIWYF